MYKAGVGGTTIAQLVIDQYVPRKFNMTTYSSVSARFIRHFSNLTALVTHCLFISIFVVRNKANALLKKVATDINLLLLQVFCGHAVFNMHTVEYRYVNNASK